MSWTAGVGRFIVIAATLGVVLWLLFSRKRNPSGNPLVLMVMAFMTSLILWLAVLGVGFLLSGRVAVRVSPHVVVIVVLLGGITLLAFAASPRSARAGVLLVPGVAILLLASGLATVGLSHVSGSYVRMAAIPWVITSLALTLVIQGILSIQRLRGKGGGSVQ